MGLQQVPNPCTWARASGCESEIRISTEEQNHQVSSRSQARLGAPREQATLPSGSLALTTRCPTLATPTPTRGEKAGAQGSRSRPNLPPH